MAFLGTARAGRAAVAAPLVVVVLAIGTATVSRAVVAAGVDASRERAAAQIVPADAVIRECLAPDTVDELGRLPGVRAVTRVLYEDDERCCRRRGRHRRRSSGRRTCCWSTARGWTLWPATPRWTCRFRPRCAPPWPGPGPLPAIVSPAVAADLAKAGLDDSAFISVQGQRYEFRVAGTEDGFPLLAANASRFVILPWQALPTRTTTPVPTSLLIAGDSLDAEVLRVAGDQGQERYQRDGARHRSGTDDRGHRRHPGGRPPGSRRAAGRTGLLAFGFVAGLSASPSWPCSPSRSPCWPGRGPAAGAVPAAHPRPVPPAVARACWSSS